LPSAATFQVVHSASIAPHCHLLGLSCTATVWLEP